MTLVRVLPRPARRDEAEGPAVGENGAAGHRPAAARLGDIDWLAFN